MDYKDLRSIQESYAAMYSEEVVDEGMADMVDKASKAAQGGLEKMGVKINRTPRPTARPSVRTQDTMRKNQSSMEEVGVFDIIKGHLIDEGFADTEEAAHSIMASMSEGWKQSIVEGPQSFPFKKVEKKMDKLRPGSHAKNIDRTSTRFNALGAARSAAQRREGGV